MTTIAFIPLIFLGVIAWAAILFRWRLGLYALIVYTPFTGLVVAAFSPSPFGNLVRDLLIIIPLYAAFLLTRRQNEKLALPLGFVAIVGLLALLITVGSAIGESAGTLVALLGAKVWLFYIPLAAVTAAYASDRMDVLRLMRLFVVMGWVPCVVGLLMWLGAINYSYKESIELVYGDFARGATQNFASFEVGQSKIYRIPATFQFAAQYAMFCIFMIFPILIQVRLDQSRNWRVFGYLSLMLVIAAALTSGSRGMFLHLPFLFAVIAMLRFGFGRGSSALIVFAFMVFGSILFSQFDESAIIDHVAELAAQNGQHIVLGGLEFAIENGGLWGKGVGIGTISTRHVLGEAALSFAAIENYYAKAWMELGMLGFTVILLLFFYLIVAGVSIAGRLRDGALRDTGLVIVAMVIFIIYISTRGWPLDQDPFSYYFWLMVGVLFKLPQIDLATAPQSASRAGQNRLRPGYPVPSLARR